MLHDGKLICTASYVLALRARLLAGLQVTNHVPALAGMPGLRQQAMTVRERNESLMLSPVTACAAQ